MRLFSLVLSGLCACSSTSVVLTDAGDAGTSDANQLLDASEGEAIVPADASKLVLTEKGGFVAQAPDGSTCTKVDATYTIALPARELAWKTCEATDSGPYAFVTGTRALTEAEYAPIQTALRALRRATKTACGADKPEEKLVVTTPSGEKAYFDDFYFCNVNDTKTYVTGLASVRAEIAKVAK